MNRTVGDRLKCEVMSRLTKYGLRHAVSFGSVVTNAVPLYRNAINILSCLLMGIMLKAIAVCNPCPVLTSSAFLRNVFTWGGLSLPLRRLAVGGGDIGGSSRRFTYFAGIESQSGHLFPGNLFRNIFYHAAGSQMILFARRCLIDVLRLKGKDPYTRKQQDAALAKYNIKLYKG